MTVEIPGFSYCNMQVPTFDSTAALSVLSSRRNVTSLGTNSNQGAYAILNQMQYG